MRPTSVVFALAAIAVGACVGTSVHQFGQYQALAPRVEPAQGERLPLHVNVAVARPADVAVFLVVPGRVTTLLFPDDSTRSMHVDAGSHQLATSLARPGGAADSARNAGRRPQGPPISGRGRTGNPRDSAFIGLGSFNTRGYLLVYASDEPLSYESLKTRVAGLSIPIDDSEALNTVTKLIRETTKAGRPWAAYATEYP